RADRWSAAFRSGAGFGAYSRPLVGCISFRYRETTHRAKPTNGRLYRAWIWPTVGRRHFVPAHGFGA
ncbi:MAG: hypothetical protein RR704_13160, partial [Stenotrophomonas sp.]